MMIQRLLILLLSIVLISCTKDNCEAYKFDLLDVRLEPRTQQMTGGNGLWSNENNLGVDRLMIRLDMPKNITGYPTSDSECPSVFINSNPAQHIKLVGDKDFNASYPSGSDLLELVTFSYFLQDFTSEEFLKNYFNESNWTSFHLTFEEIPDNEGLHNLVFIAILNDGSTLESPPVEILLIPSE